MTPDMGIVGRQSHQKVDQGHDHQDAGGRGNEEHQLRLLDVVNAEHLDLCLALHQHVHTLRSLWKQKVEWVEVNTSLIPLDFLSAAHTWNGIEFKKHSEYFSPPTPAERVEGGDNDAAEEDQYPGHQEDVGDEDEAGGGHSTSNPSHMAPVDLHAGGPGGQEAGDEDHEGNGGHAGSQDHEGQLGGLHPLQPLSHFEHIL